MKLQLITEGQISISYDVEDYTIQDGIENLLGHSNIYISRNKEPISVAVDNETGEVVGCVWAAWDNNSDDDTGEEITDFSWDVFVRQDYRAFKNVGPKLIETAFEYYYEFSDAYENPRMLVEVINERLVGFLAKKYGLSVSHDRKRHDGGTTVYMTDSPPVSL